MKINEVDIIEQLKDSEHLTVILADGSIGRIRKDKLLGTTINHEYLTTSWATEGWHRIASCAGSNALISSAIVSMGNTYGSSIPDSACFYYAGSGCGGRVASVIGKIGSLFKKVRVVYKDSISDDLYIDVYYSLNKRNSVFLSASSIINLKFTFQWDTIATIPEGYSVEEFIL